MLTYGDGLCDVNLKKLLRFHNTNRCIATLTAVRPPARFGGIKISKNNVYEFKLNRSSLRIKDNEGKFSYFFTPPVTEGGVSGIF